MLLFVTIMAYVSMVLIDLQIVLTQDPSPTHTFFFVFLCVNLQLSDMYTKHEK